MQSILQWLNDTASQLPDELPVAEFISRLRRHRLEGRASERLDGHVPPAARGLADALAARRDQRLVFAQTRKATIRRLLLAHAREGAGRIALLKGMTLHLLTGRSACLYDGGDIDLLAEDPESLCETLSRLGFVRTGDAAPHEYANMTDGEVSVDIHHSVPALAYPQDIGSVRELHAHDHGVMIQSTVGSAREQYIEGRRFFSGFSGAIVEREGIPVLSPHWAALVRCLYVFRDYYWQPFSPDNLKFGHVLEVRDLIQQEGVSEKALLTDALALGLGDSVRFTLSMLALLERAPSSLPDALWRLRKCVNGSAGPWLWMDGDWDPLSMLDVAAIESLRPALYSPVEPGRWRGDTRESRRALFWCQDADPIHFTYEIELEAEHLKLAIQPDSRACDAWGVKVELGVDHAEAVIMDGRHLSWGRPGVLNASRDSYSVRFARGDRPSQPRMPPFVISLWKRTGSWQASVVLPMALAVG